MRLVGQLGIDWAETIDYARLRRERLSRAQEMMRQFDLEAAVLVIPENIRYVTGTWGLGLPKVLRYCVLAQEGMPVMYEQGPDIGRISDNAPWLEGRIRVGIPLGMVGQEEVKLWGKQIADTIQELGVKDKTVGMDRMDFRSYRAMEEAGLQAVDCSSVLAQARMIKTQDELNCLRISVGLGEVGLQAAREAMKIGARECDVAAAMYEALISRGCSLVRGVVTAMSSPYWRTWVTDRQLRNGDIVIIDRVHVYNGYGCDYVRAFLIGDKATAKQKDLFKQCYDRLYRAIEQFKPGNTTADVARELKEAEDFSEFTLHFGHGLGVDTHEYPYITFLSKKNPVELQPNMVFAVETYAGDGQQGVRLEEDLIVTDRGYEIISLYPFDEKLKDF